MTVWEALDSLRSPGAGEFFGRIDEPRAGRRAIEQWYIGRRHIEDDEHDPVVVDWRAPISAPFYRATAVDPLGVSFRRRFTLDRGRADRLPRRAPRRSRRRRRRGRHPRPRAGRDRRRPLGRDARDRRDDPGRAGHRDPRADRPGPDRAGRSRAPARRRSPCTVPPTCCSSTVAGWRATACSSSGRTGRSSTTSPTCCRRSASAACGSARRSTCASRRSRSTGVDDPATARWKGRRDRLAELERRGARRDPAARPTTSSCRSGLGTDVFDAGRDRRVDRHGQVGRRADQPAPRAAAGARPAGAAPAHRRRRRVVAGRPVEGVLINGAGRRSSRSTSSTACCPGASGASAGRGRSADQFLVDEANTLLNGTPFTYGHVVVDEAQDHSAVALRVIGRRSPRGSMTLVGDVAQSTTPAGQERWADVFATSPAGYPVGARQRRGRGGRSPS